MSWIAPVSVLAILLLWTTDFVRNEPLIRHVVLSLVAAAVVLGAWVATNRVPRVPKGRVGIVLALGAEDSVEARQLESDFERNLAQLVSADTSNTKFHLLRLPHYLRDRARDDDACSRLLSQTGGVFLLAGLARQRITNGAPSHVIDLSGYVRHPDVGPQIKGLIAADFRSVLPRQIQFAKDNDAIAFAFTSEWTEIAARYMIGLAALVAGDVWYAETLLLSVEARLAIANVATTPFNVVKLAVPARIVSLYENWLNALSSSHFATRRGEFIAAAEPVADKLLARQPHHYNALLMKAMCMFTLRRDVAGAKIAVRRAKVFSDSTWRYSLAFLLAYEGDLTEAAKEYQFAFSSRLTNDSVPIQCEEFIDIVLADEPDKCALHYASALINDFAKRDRNGAIRDYRAFVEHPGSGAFARQRTQAEAALRRLGAYAQ